MNLEQFKKEQGKLSAALEKHSRGMLVEEFKNFFDANPTVKSVAWTQYTPHFNDGDVCEFSRHEFNVAGDLDNDLKASYKDSPDYEFDDTAFFGSWSFEDRSEVKRALKVLEKTLGGDTEAVFRAAFGDGYRIIATRKGFNVEEYDHD
jgi:hypothetical protein